MKRTFLKLATLSLLLFLFSACQESYEFKSGITETDKKISQRTNVWLFNAIELSVNGQGTYQFVASVSTVTGLLEDILIDRNAILTSVDTFGFAYTTLGTQYFFAVQEGVSSSLTLFGWLDSQSGNISDTYGDLRSGHGWTCSNKQCCAKCVAHDSLICTCHDIQEDCLINGGSGGECIQDRVSIEIESIFN